MITGDSVADIVPPDSFSSDEDLLQLELDAHISSDTEY